MNVEVCANALSDVKSFVRGAEEGFSEGRSSWYWVERWVHVRRPQYRRAVAIRDDVEWPRYKCEDMPRHNQAVQWDTR